MYSSMTFLAYIFITYVYTILMHICIQYLMFSEPLLLTYLDHSPHLQVDKLLS